MLKRSVLFVFLLLILYVGNAFLNPFPTKKVPDGFRPKYGFSYSFEQGNWYGYDARKEFVWLVDNIRFDWVRLPFFWDQMTQLRQGSDGQAQQSQGSDGQDAWEFNKNFEDLKFGINEARKRNIKVIVVVGVKTPFYPEYHIPARLASKIKFGDTIGTGSPIARDILDVDSRVVAELSTFDNIAYWQVENEPFLANVNNWKIDHEFLGVETAVVRQADSKKRPIILTSEGALSLIGRWKSFFDLLKPNDIFGVNAYFSSQGTTLFAFSAFGHNIRVPWPKGFAWPVQSWYLLSPDYSDMKKTAAGHGLDTWVMEMQADPYVRTLDDAHKNDLYFKAVDIKRGDNFLRALRMDSVGFWGANYWLFRKSIGDNSWVNAVGELVN